MRAFFDTSVLVPALVDQLSNHERCFPSLVEYSSGNNQGFCSTHNLAECYSVLTALPLRLRINPADAELLIRESVIGRLTVVEVETKDYLAAIERASGRGLVSGIIYDALHLIAAERVKCDRLFTFNVDHFRKLSDGGPAITAP